MCFNESCKQRAAIICNSGCTAQFHCDHIDKAVDHLSKPQEKHDIDAEKFSAYPRSDSVCKEMHMQQRLPAILWVFATSNVTRTVCTSLIPVVEKTVGESFLKQNKRKHEQCVSILIPCFACLI